MPKNVKKECIYVYCLKQYINDGLRKDFYEAYHAWKDAILETGRHGKWGAGSFYSYRYLIEFKNLVKFNDTQVIPLYIDILVKKYDVAALVPYESVQLNKSLIGKISLPFEVTEQYRMHKTIDLWFRNEYAKCAAGGLMDYAMKQCCCLLENSFEEQVVGKTLMHKEVY